MGAKDCFGHLVGAEDACVWWRTAAPLPEFARLEERQEAEVAIVGGGYTGLSTALHLARQGIDVVVLEARGVGFGGSGRNAGHCTPTFHLTSPDRLRARLGRDRAERLIRMQITSADLVFGLIDRYDIDCEAVRNGYLRIAHGPHRLAELQAKRDLYASLGLKGDLLGASEAKRISGSPRAYGGWLLHGAGHLNPAGFARGLARAAVGEGARIFEQSPVQAIDRVGKGWRLTTPEGEMTARRVLMATGAYGVGVGRRLLSGAFHPVRITGLASAPLSAAMRRSILPFNTTVVDTHKDPILYKWTADHRLVTTVYVSGRLGRDVEATKAYVDGRTRWFFPQIEALDWDGIWSGLLDAQPLTVPIAHHLAPDLWACIGFSGRGVPTATAAGAEMAKLLAGKARPEIALPIREGVDRLSGIMASAHGVAMAWWRIKDAFASRRQGIEEYHAPIRQL